MLPTLLSYIDQGLLAATSIRPREPEVEETSEEKKPEVKVQQCDLAKRYSQCDLVQHISWTPTEGF